MPYIRFLSGPKANETLKLGHGSIVVGRSQDCDVVLPNAMVSRHHAQIVAVDELYYVEDLGSRNGTSLNGKRIHTRMSLADRDWVEIDDVLFEFNSDRSAALAPNVVELDSSASLSDSVDEGQQPNSAAQRSDAVTAPDMCIDGGWTSEASPQVKLQAVLEVTRHLGSSLDSKSILERLLESVFRVFPRAKRVEVFQVESPTGNLRPIASKHSGTDADPSVTLGPVSQQLIRRVMAQKEAAQSGEGSTSAAMDSVHEDDTPSIMCAPLLGHSRSLLGAIYVESKDRDEQFSRADLDLLVCIAILAAQSMEYARTHDKLFRAIVDSALHGIITFDSQGKIESANPAAERMFGYAPGELARRDVFKLLRPLKTSPNGNGGNPLDGMRLESCPKFSSTEYSGRRSDGSSFSMEMSIGEFALDRGKYFTLICHDVTARKKAENALRRSQERLVRMVKTGVVGIAFSKSNGRIFEVNDAMLKLIAYTREEVRSQNIDWIRLTPAEYADVDRKALKELKRKGAFGPYEKEFIRKDAQRLPVSLSVAVLPGQKQEYVTFVVDNTQRKKAEAELRELNASLERRVAQRTQHVQLMQDIAVIANQAETVQGAFRRALPTICRRFNWPGGCTFLVSERAPEMLIQNASWFHHCVTGTGNRLCVEAPTGVKRAGQMARMVISTGKPSWTADLERASCPPQILDSLKRHANSLMMFPVLIGEQTRGVIELFTSADAEPNEELQQVMTNVATQLGRVIERRQMQKELVDAVWQKQHEIGQELHDSLGQELTGIRMISDALRRRLEDRSVPEAADAAELAELIHDVQDRIRTLSKGLFPVELFDDGLMAALANLAESVRNRFGIACNFHCAQQAVVPDHETAVHLYRIAQEAIHNALKHSRADRIEISLSADQQHLKVAVVDNGIGIEKLMNNRRSGMGLRIMRYRAEAVGGILTIASTPGKGTAIECITEQGLCHEHLPFKRQGADSHCG